MKEQIIKQYQRWLNSSRVLKEDKELLKGMSEKEIDDAFFKRIEFGTAGIRGVLGPGTNRMNSFTVLKATVGFGLYLKEKFKDPIKVVISHDNRFKSREFTLESAAILNKMGIDTYIFDSLRPTPELSFALRYKNCQGGIMITASHNPKEYNGFKVYDEYGSQLIPKKIARLIEIISSLDDELELDIPATLNPGTNEVLGQEVDDEYVRLVEEVQINKGLKKDDFKIVYTPNHGTSYVNAMRVFNDLGYNVTPVLLQIEPDPNFSGTLSPNPEDEKSYIEPIKIAKEIDADLICMTDPDGDRVGLACKNKMGEYTLINGNEGAAILLEYIFSSKKRKGTLPANGVIYNTVVSSALGAKIAANYGIKCETFLTGFKFIGDRIQYHEENHGPTFEFGYEESYGCLIAPFVRDKDGIQAILLYCEAALYYHLQGKTLLDVYAELGQKYGYHKADLYSIFFKGSEGSEKMNTIMEELNEHPFKELLNNKVVIFEDYFSLKRLDLKTKETTPITGLPHGDLVKFIFDDGTNICIRPSGTEPKCKFYVEVIEKDLDATKGLSLKYFNEIKRLYIDE